MRSLDELQWAAATCPARLFPAVNAEEVLALVRVVRAAQALTRLYDFTKPPPSLGLCQATNKELDDALAPWRE